jgi:hypothetical protein
LGITLSVAQCFGSLYRIMQQFTVTTPIYVTRIFELMGIFILAIISWRIKQKLLFQISCIGYLDLAISALLRDASLTIPFQISIRICSLAHAFPETRIIIWLFNSRLTVTKNTINYDEKYINMCFG